MPVTHYIVPAADLTSVANAIRSKANTSSSMSFPTGFINAIGSISGSGESIDWNRMASSVRAAKHIHPGVSINSQEAFIKAMDLKDVSPTETLFSSSYTIYYRWSSHSAASTISAKSIRYYTANLTSGLPVRGAMGGLYSRKTSVAVGSSGYIVEHVFLTSSNDLTVALYNPSSLAVTILSAVMYSERSVRGVWYSVSTYDHYWPSTTLTWWRDLDNKSIWLSGFNNYGTPGVVSNFTTIKSAWRLVSFNDVYLSRITTIGSLYFYNCSQLSAVYETESVTKISQSAFFYCSNLSSASFPNCSSIGYGAFMYCSNLENVYFGNCNSISSYAFLYCSKLRSVYLSGSVVPTLGTYAFVETPIMASTLIGGYGSIYVPASLLTDYQTANGWSAFSQRFVPVYD